MRASARTERTSRALTPLALARPASIAALATLACSATACDPGEVAAPRFEQLRVAPARDFLSGSRLRARYHVVDGLVTAFTTFHDTALDADCAFEDENGSHVGPGAASYCFPSGMARHRQDKGPFSDPACTVRTAFAPAAAAKYALVEPLDACVTAPTVHLAAPPSTRTTFFLGDNGDCIGGEGARVQALGAAVPPGTFVRATEQVEVGFGRISVRVLVGEDGSRRAVGGFDRLRNEAVRVGIADDGQRRWLPARVAFVGGLEPFFADSACARGVASKVARTATCPLSASVVLEGTCGLGHYYELGERVTSLFHRTDQNECARRNAGDLYAHRIGAPIPPSEFAAVTSADIGTPRVRRRSVAASDGDAVGWSDVIDARTGEPCAVVATADGSLRCLPAIALPVAFFADDACTEPAISRASTGCDDGTDSVYVRDALEAPPRVFATVREVDAIYNQSGDRCIPAPPSVPSRFFAVTEVAASQFPLATEGAD